MLRLVRPGHVHADITGLFLGKHGQPGAQTAQVQAGQTLEYRVISDNRIGFDIIAVEP